MGKCQFCKNTVEAWLDDADRIVFQVAGEISSKNPSTLRRGFLWAVAVVGILYMALNAVFVSDRGIPSMALSFHLLSCHSSRRFLTKI